mgnify:CR=1 FL=1
MARSIPVIAANDEVSTTLRTRCLMHEFNTLRVPCNAGSYQTNTRTRTRTNGTNV